MICTISYATIFDNIFGRVKYFTDFWYMLMTITDYAAKKGVTTATVYSWIYRNQAEKNGFEVVKIGKVSLIKEIAKKKKITT